MPALRQLAEQELVGERLLDLLLDQPRQRPGAVGRIVAVLGEPGPRRRAQPDGDVAVGELLLKLDDEFVDHPLDDRRRERGEADRGVEAVAELRREHPLDRLLVVARALGAGEADGRLGELGSAGVGGHDEDDVAEIDALAVVVGELPVVHDLQEDVEQVGVRLFDLVEQQDHVRVLVGGIGEQAALVEADVAGRRADQTR